MGPAKAEASLWGRGARTSAGPRARCRLPCKAGRPLAWNCSHGSQRSASRVEWSRVEWMDGNMQSAPPVRLLRGAMGSPSRGEPSRRLRERPPELPSCRRTHCTHWLAGQSVARALERNGRLAALACAMHHLHSTRRPDASRRPLRPLGHARAMWPLLSAHPPPKTGRRLAID